MSVEEISIAIETSCRAGGVALGRGQRLQAACDFDAAGRHAAQLIVRLDALLTQAGLRPQEIAEVYVSAGPGSFTGLRVGITVARMLAQTVTGLRCISVPTSLAVAENARELLWQRLGVVFDTGAGAVYATTFCRKGDRIIEAVPPAIVSAKEFLAKAPRPILLTGEALGYYDLSGEGIELADEDLWLPRAQGVWRVGRRLAEASAFTDRERVLPIYPRPPEAQRRWLSQRTGC